MHSKHFEDHKISSVGFLRAAVLGANDGLISTSSLIVGLAFAGLNESQIITTSIAALIAGAMSMAAGEYVSVSSQADTEAADLKKEILELEEDPESELRELEGIYVKRGLSKPLAKEVAKELTNHNALEAHLRDELGIIEIHKAKPFQAAFASAIMFSIGAILPICIVYITNLNHLVLTESIFTTVLLFIMGAIAAKVGGAKMLTGAIRVSFWGIIAMGFTAFVGRLFETNIF